jgi:PAS domain S-box-containing protein
MNHLRLKPGWVRRLVPYGVAIGSTGLALRFSLWFAPLLEGTIGSFFYIAIIVSTWYGGIRPGMVAIALSSSAINYFFTPPVRQFSIASSGDIVRLGIFLLVALVINLLNSDLRRSKHKVEQLNRQLLQESSDRLKMALTAAQMGMWDWDIVTGEIIWSPEHEQLFGLTPDTFDGRYETFDACLYPDDRAGLLQVLQAALQSHSIYQYEYRVIWADGSVHWVEGRGQAFYDEAGQPIRMSGTVIDIDDRKRNEAQRNQLIEQEQTARQAAQAAQKQITTILESISDAFVSLDTQWCYTYVNAKAAQLFNRRPDELIGKNIWVEFPEGVGQPFYHAYYQAVSSQQSIQLEEYYPPWDRWFENRIYPSEEGLTIFFQEITDRKRAEIALMSSEQHLRAILDAEPECVKIITREGILRSMNPAGLAIMEADSLEQVQGKEIFSLISPPYREAFQMFTQQVASGQAGAFEFEGIGLKGTRRWLESHAVSLQHPGDPTTYILVVSRDITDRKQAEAELRMLNTTLEQRVAERTNELSVANNLLQKQLFQREQVERALRASEVRFRSAFEYAAIGMALVKPDGHWLRVNRALCDIVGYSNQELLTTDFQTITHPDDLTTDLDCVYQLLNDEIQTYQMEKRYIHKHGQIVWVLLSVSLVRDEQNQPLYFISQIQNISDRKQAEASLRSSEERLQFALEASRDGLWDWNIVTGEIYHSPQYLEILGYAAGEAEETGIDLSRWEQLIHPEDKPAVFELLNTHLHDAAIEYALDYRVLTKSGAWKWITDYGKVVVRDSQGTPLRMTGTYRDITARKHIEAALQESELKFHAMFDQSRLFIGLLQPDGIVFEVNLRPHELTAMMGEVFVGHYFWELAIWGTNHQHQMREIFDRALAGEVVQIERVIHTLDGSVLKLPDGSLVTHDIRVKAVKNAANQVMFLTVEGWDITALKQAEAELREADRRWRSLFDNVQLVVIELDIQGNVKYANPFFLHLTGYPLEEVLGRDWFDSFLSVGQKQPVETCFREVLEYNFHAHYQNPILTRSGAERMIAWNNTVLRDTSGHPIGTISIGEDITERYQLEQMKAEFVSVVSHELRTPLTSMQAALSLLVEKIIDPTSEEGEAIIQIASDGVDRLVRLVNDILDLERLESGKVRLEKRRCNTADLMTIAVDQMQEMAKQERIRLDVTANRFEMNADPDRILQVLTNLLSNAIKFAPSDSVVCLGVEPEIVQDSSAQTYLRFRVKDLGRGIPAEKLDSIFERFQQVDASDSRQKGGTGLGLAICRSIVEQHGGRIWAESYLGQGSTFYFRIPALDKTSDDTKTSFNH